MRAYFWENPERITLRFLPLLATPGVARAPRGARQREWAVLSSLIRRAGFLPGAAALLARGGRGVTAPIC